MYCAYVTTITELHKHSNADRLQCATIFGNNVIVGLDAYIGQRVVYFPSDGQLSEEFAEANNLVRKKDECGNDIGGYLDPKKRNIKAMNLRGEKSDGLIMPIESLSPYTNIDDLKDGDQISVLNGVEICRKYIPRTNSRPHGGNPKAKNLKEEKEQISYPFFAEHVDTEQLAYNEKAFRSGDIVYITRKLHGTSFRVSNAVKVTKRRRLGILKKLFGLGDKEKRSYNIVSGTRRVVLRTFEGGWHGTNKFRQKYHDMLADNLPKGFTVYGEIVGWVNETTPIMGRCKNSKVKDKEFKKMYGDETIFSYGCEPGENDCYVYRITHTNEDGIVTEIPTEETKIWCERLGMKFVPILDKFLFTTWDDLMERVNQHLDVPEPIANGSHVTEGIVARIDNRSKFTAYKQKGYFFKVLEGIIKDESDQPDMEEAEEFVNEQQ